MANLNLKFLRGLQSALPTAGTDGYFYLTTDTHRLYTSIDGKVVPVNEGVTTVANLEALTSVTGAQAGDFFYCTEENILAVYNGQKFVQINPDTGVTSVEVVGDGNAVTAASYDPATRKLTLTKGETFALPADISNAVGELGNDAEGNAYANVKAYVDAKTAGIATDAALGELIDRVATAEGEIDALQEASAKHVEKVDGKSLIADTEITRLAGMSDGANKVEASETNGNIKIDGVETVVYTHPEKHAIDDITGLQDALDGKSDDDHKHVAADITDLDTTIKGYDYATKAEAQAMADGKDEAIAAAKKAGDDAAAALDTYKGEMTAALAGKQDVIPENTYDAHGSAAKALEDAKKYTDGEIAKIPAQTDYSVTITENTDDATVAKTYVFSQCGAEIGSIKLAKELVVTSGSVKEVTEAEKPYAGAKVGEKYIELVIANQDAPIYVPAKDLVDIYTAKDGAAEVQVAISNTNEISATLVNGGVAEEKLADGVKTKLNKTWEEVGVAADLVEALENGQVKTNKEAIENITKEGGLIATAKQEAIDAAAGDATTKANAAKDAAIADAAEKYETKGTAQGIVDGLKLGETYEPIGAETRAKSYADTELAKDRERLVALEAIDHNYADADATLKAELQKEIDDDVKVVGDDLAGYKISNDAAVALKANAADVYGKTETYNKTEIEALLTWGEF